jgi:hypothetical protein
VVHNHGLEALIIGDTMSVAHTKLDRFLELKRTGLPTVTTEYFTSERLPEITNAIKDMLREHPAVWIRTDNGSETSPLIQITSLGDLENFGEFVRDLPKKSDVMLIPSYKEGLFSGIILVTKEKQVILEFVPSTRYRDLSQGRITPKVSYIKDPGHPFNEVINVMYSTGDPEIGLIREVATNILRELTEKRYLDTIFGLMKEKDKVLALEFDWHSKSGMLFVDLVRK